MPADTQAPVDRGLSFLAGLMAVVGGAALFALVGITIVSVFWRYILRDPIFGIEDLSTMGLATFVAGAVAYGAVKGAHVTVNVITMVAGRRVTRLSDAIARALGFAIVAFATYGLFTKGACGMPCGAMTPNMGIIHTPFYFLLGAGFGFYALLLFWQLVQGLRHWTGEDPNEVRD